MLVLMHEASSKFCPDLAECNNVSGQGNFYAFPPPLIMLTLLSGRNIWKIMLPPVTIFFLTGGIGIHPMVLDNR